MSEKLTVTINNQKGRLDKLLTEELADYSRSQIQSWLKEGLVFSITTKQVVKANYKVKDTETFEIQLPEVQELEILPEDIPLEIVYEDKDVAVVNKPCQHIEVLCLIMRMDILHSDCKGQSSLVDGKW